MTPIDRIRKVHVDIMRHDKWCALSGVLAMGKTEIDPTCPTAYTNGVDKRYNPDFVASLDTPQLRLLVLHETMHVAFRHLAMWAHLWKENAKLANIAADHFVNLALVDGDAGEGWLSMPPCGVQPDPRYRGWSVQRIFDDLKSNPDNPDEPDGAGGGFDQHDWKAGEEMTEAESQSLSDAVQRALRQGEQVARSRGKGSSNSAGVIGDLLSPQVDWRAQLRDFVQTSCASKEESTWRRPHRRFVADDVYMPSMDGVQVGELAVVVDTSGSCFGTQYLSAFISELGALIEQTRPTKVRVLYVDTAVSGEQVFEDGTFAVHTLKPTGGGGTNLPAAYRYVAEKRYAIEAMIFLTDLETPFGTAPSYPVLWVTDSADQAPYGTTIKLEV